jgi:hypothetical protein
VASSTVPTAQSGSSRYPGAGHLLRWHLDSYGTASDGRLFRGLRGGILSESVYGRAWHTACNAALRPLSVTAQTVRQVGPQNLGQRKAWAAELATRTRSWPMPSTTHWTGWRPGRKASAGSPQMPRTSCALRWRCSGVLTEVALDDPQVTQDLRHLGAHLLRANERNERLIDGCSCWPRPTAASRVWCHCDWTSWQAR